VSTSRWRTWVPGDSPKFCNNAEHPPTEPPKVTFDGFGSGHLPLFKKIETASTVLLVGHFPRCPGCGSHDLYHENGSGPYECLTCEQQGISEAEARGFPEHMDWRV
jgi:hypothetical protein